MKWFKHDSAASLDAKLARVRLKYGMEGYGLYWFCLESIARNVETHNLTFELEEDAELLSVATNIHYERVQEMMTYMVNLGLFENCDGRITCLKMATRTDEYTQKLLRNSQSVPTLSRHTPDKVPPIRTEENRIEENRVEKKKKARPTKTTMPDDFLVTPEMQEWVITRHPHLDYQSATEEWTFAMKAKGFQYVNWKMAWHNAMGKANEWKKERNNGNTKNTINGVTDSRRLSPGDRTRQLREQRFAERASAGTPDMGCVGDNA
jgi:hypothetical protein